LCLLVVLFLKRRAIQIQYYNLQLEKMSNPGFFKDLSKRVSDLLTKDFPSEKQENKIEWKGQADNNVNVETNFVQKKDGSWIGTFIPKYKFKEYGTTVSAEISTKKEYKAEVAVEDKVAAGLKTIVSAHSKGDDLYGTVGFDYKHDYATVSASADYGKASGSTVKAHGVVGHQGFSLGASAEYFVGSSQDSSLKELHTILGYSSLAFDIGAFGKIKNEDEDEKNEIGLNYFHRVNDDLSVGTEVVFDTANTDSKPKLTLGSRYVVDRDSVVKTKFDTEAKIGFSYQQKYNKNTKFTLSSTVDGNNFASKGSSTFGFTLSFEY